jgi:hypothetical protein
MSKLGTLTLLAILCGCGGAKHPLATDDGGAGAVGTGTGGVGSGTGGSGAGTGGSTATGGSGGTAGGGTGGTGTGTGGNTGGGFGGIPDGGLGGILDSGLVGGCPANPSGQACGGQGTPPLCYTPAADGGTPAACGCVAMRWVCLGQGGLGGGDGGQGMGMLTACPANPAGMSCTQGSFCMNGGGFCGCLAGAWRCMP